MIGRASPSRRLIICAVPALLAGLVVLVLVPWVFGAPRAMVQVAWREVPDDERDALEARFSLGERQAIGPREFAYVPDDTTTATLAALVAHPAILATEGIDRRMGVISASAPLTARRGGVITAPRAARAARAGGTLLLALGVALAVASAGLTATRASRAHDWWTAYWRSPGRFARHVAAVTPAWLERGIPAASPEAAGIFRIAFVSCVLAAAVLEPAAQRSIPPADVVAIAGPYGTIVRWMAANPSSLWLVDMAVWVCGALAVTGLATRAAFAAFAGFFLLWACAFTTRTTLHTVSALQVTLIALLAARWGEAWSLDAWIRRRMTGAVPDHVPSRRHGFAMWVPGFVLGVAYLAAAWAKVGHGPAWVLNGTARQHFLTDLDQAWTSWGPVLTATPLAAVALSAAAIAVEALAISAAFVHSWRYRLAVGGTVFSLLAGFALFQGIVWPAWWVLLLGFLPWQLIGRREADARAGSAAALPAGWLGANSTVTSTQLGAIVAVLVLQVGASFVMRDFRPFISGYDMYATTHGPEIDNARALERVRVVGSSPEGWVDVAACTFDLPVAGDAATTAARRAAFPDHLSTCLGADTAGPIRLDLDRQTYDWSSHSLQWRRRVDVAGPYERTALPATWPFMQ
jgi:hypothetical protein